MEPKTFQFKKYQITFFCKEELKTLIKEIFSQRIYDIKLDSKTPIIIDAGAHIGLSTIYFKEQYPQATILAFEPNPNTLPILEENIEMNSLQNVQIYGIALGKKKCKREFYIDSSGNCAFSTSSFNKNAWNGKQQTVPIEVEVHKLSEYINTDIDLLKVDIEGAEEEVLKDLKQSGKIKYIKNIVVEYHPNKRKPLNKLLSEYFSDMEIETRELGEGLILILGKKRF